MDADEKVYIDLENPLRNAGYATIPKVVLLHSGKLKLTSRQLHLITTLYALMPYVFSVREIAKLMGKSMDAVQAAASELIEMGYVRREQVSEFLWSWKLGGLEHAATVYEKDHPIATLLRNHSRGTVKSQEPVKSQDTVKSQEKDLRLDSDSKDSRLDSESESKELKSNNIVRVADDVTVGNDSKTNTPTKRKASGKGKPKQATPDPFESDVVVNGVTLATAEDIADLVDKFRAREIGKHETVPVFINDTGWLTTRSRWGHDIRAVLTHHQALTITQVKEALRACRLNFETYGYHISKNGRKFHWFMVIQSPKKLMDSVTDSSLTVLETLIDQYVDAPQERQIEQRRMVVSRNDRGAVGIGQLFGQER